MKTTILTSALFTILATTASATPTPQAAEPVYDGAVNAVVEASQEVSIMAYKAVDGSLTYSDERLVTKRDADAAEVSVPHLDKRVGPIILIIGLASPVGLALITKLAVEIGQSFVKNLGDWNRSREAFTKKTTAEMWARNPDYRRYPAAICYNRGYSFQNGRWSGRVKVKYSLGSILTTDYDCMYMEGGNQFYTHNEGGYINLSYHYNGQRCSHDRRTGDLTCR